MAAGCQSGLRRHRDLRHRPRHAASRSRSASRCRSPAPSAFCFEPHNLLDIAAPRCIIPSTRTGQVRVCICATAKSMGIPSPRQVWGFLRSLGIHGRSTNRPTELLRNALHRSRRKKPAQALAMLASERPRTLGWIAGGGIALRRLGDQPAVCAGTGPAGRGANELLAHPGDERAGAVGGMGVFPDLPALSRRRRRLHRRAKSQPNPGRGRRPPPLCRLHRHRQPQRPGWLPLFRPAASTSD